MIGAPEWARWNVMVIDKAGKIYSNHTSILQNAISAKVDQLGRSGSFRAARSDTE